MESVDGETAKRWERKISVGRKMGSWKKSYSYLQ